MFSLPLLLSLVSAASAWTPASSNVTDGLVADSMSNLLELAANGTLKSYLATQNVSQTCTKETLAVRKEYSTLTTEEKLDYINAMKCMFDAPGLTPAVSHT